MVLSFCWYCLNSAKHFLVRDLPEANSFVKASGGQPLHVWKAVRDPLLQQKAEELAASRRDEAENRRCGHDTSRDNGSYRAIIATGAGAIFRAPALYRRALLTGFIEIVPACP